jgi:dihydroxy-acid dehydratase
MARRAGRRIVEMVWEDLKPSDILTPAAFDNAITVDMAIGGSTNAIIHLIAMAGRAGIKLPLERFDEIPIACRWSRTSARPANSSWRTSTTPADCAGCSIASATCFSSNCQTVSGRTLGEDIEGATSATTTSSVARQADLAGRGDVRPPRQPRARRLRHQAHVRRAAAAEAHRAGTGVQELPDLKARIDDESLNVTPTPSSCSKRRPAGRAGHAGVGHAAHPEETAEAGRARHGSRLATRA